MVSGQVTIFVVVYKKRRKKSRRSVSLEFHNFLNDMEREKPIRSSVQQLQTATDNLTNLLGTGGFGAVYKGIFGNGVLVTVKVLNRSSVKRIEEQLKADLVITIGRIHGFNLVPLYGYCFL
ncbi:hypothetical protein DVH24_018921 [Malus domestica]|uniref:Protein kinase domain-containing protein n=1 Tax=Malus domestica TaxID=3750 RepID=A0A498HJC8_MALDO|nr:hypothetical protein DVH24_018921 [Malus domestica]